MRRSKPLRSGKPLDRSGTLRRSPTKRRPKPPEKRCPPGLRDLVLARDGYRCRRCGATGPLTLSHRLPEGNGGPWAPFNLDTLCGSGTTGCHGWVEHHFEAAVKEGWRIPGRVIVKNGTVTFFGIPEGEYASFRTQMEEFVAASA